MTALKSSLILLTVALMASVVFGEGTSAQDKTDRRDVPAPIKDCENAFELAGRTKLRDMEPEEQPDLHNLFRLSENIFTGGEPLTKAALRRIADEGVKTVLSVDGKVPDAATAKALGMRYVHVPIRYGGITQDQVAKIAKTFRELEPPFYVHCFHGKHRGPAAAAIGRIVIDEQSRETAIAEMRRCGTAGKYEGLYQSIATGKIPSAKESRAYGFAFDEAHPFKGVRAAMIKLTRSFDHIKDAKARGFKPDPEHPDVDAANEAAKLRQFFERMNATGEVAGKRADYRDWMDASVVGSRAMEAALLAGDGKTANKHLGTLKQLCTSCHDVYRNR